MTYDCASFGSFFVPLRLPLRASRLTCDTPIPQHTFRGLRPYLENIPSCLRASFRASGLAFPPLQVSFRAFGLHPCIFFGFFLCCGYLLYPLIEHPSGPFRLLSIPYFSCTLAPLGIPDSIHLFGDDETVVMAVVLARGGKTLARVNGKKLTLPHVFYFFFSAIGLMRPNAESGQRLLRYFSTRKITVSPLRACRCRHGCLRLCL